ncbi:unnamed protein product [Cyprideis torosa]|uniref:Uncharacterized protein n=1 Tax=Cyprideis torosa TaxID=163714 RepID=A0A7R8W244_9CRUS|nr:unnamed protein product [Cyprideis torosa]CAG0881551.1 unnamed protein product [Cyprideis torosa]
MDWPLSCPRTSRELSPPGGESSHQSRGGGDSSTEEEEESDDDSSSSSSAKKTMAEVDEALSKFRVQWKEELISKEQCEKREKAVSLYTKGILLENSGHIGDAVSCYQRANHLLPEIDVMFHTAFRAQRNTQGSTPSSRTSRASSPTVGQEDYGSDNKMSPNCGDENVDLYKLFSKALILGRGSWCDRNQEQQATHISSLPPEIVLLIMRWIVGKDLDLRSMEILSQVCRGFYLLVRDDGIWRDACLQVHGAHILQKKNLGSLTYRDVWVSQPRPNFNGVYISRTSYVRMGENSFQDTSSRPWHLVEYFRYIRFFPEGYCLTCTTPDPPKQTIPNLRDRDCKIPQQVGDVTGKADQYVFYFQDTNYIAFPDIRPASTHHYLVITRKHIPDIKHIHNRDIPLVEGMLAVGRTVLLKQGGDPNQARNFLPKKTSPIGGQQSVYVQLCDSYYNDECPEYEDDNDQCVLISGVQSEPDRNTNSKDQCPEPTSNEVKRPTPPKKKNGNKKPPKQEEEDSYYVTVEEYEVDDYDEKDDHKKKKVMLNAR